MKLIFELIQTLSEPSSNYDDIDDSIRAKLIAIKKVLDSDKCVIDTVRDDIENILSGNVEINEAFI